MTADEALPRVERGEDNHPVFFHACTDVPLRRTILPLSHETGWWWQGDDTLMPSIHCHTCDTHGWWREGKWEGV
jgi:Family of unknown function (DUF6527)